MADNPPVTRKASWRMGARQRERLQWTVVAVICVLLFFALRPYYLRIVEVRDFQTCQSNMLQIARGISLYSDDNDSALPIGTEWMNTVSGYLAARSGTGFKVSDIFHCPLDKTGSPSSYAWNDVLNGYSPVHKNLDEAAAARLAKAGRPDRIPLVFEKHGSALNAHFPVASWDELKVQLTLPHSVTGMTGSIITGGQKPSSVSADKLATRAGDRF